MAGEMVDQIETDDLDTEAGIETEPAGGDLRSALESAFSEASTADDETPAQAASRVRDEQGRFTKGQPSEGVEQSITELDTAPPIAPPSSWTGEKQQMFHQLPRPLQEEVVRRESDLRRYLTTESEKIAQAQRTYSGIDAALAPYNEQIRLAGAEPGQVIGHMMAWQQFLDRDPAQALHQLAQSYGLDLRQLANIESQTVSVPPYVQEMRQQLDELKRFRAQQEMQVQQSHQNHLTAEVQVFAGETDANGHALRPYLENVIEDMLPMVQMMKSQDPSKHPRQILQEAYERAVWANPTTRQLEIQRREKEQAIAQRQKAEQARKASKLVNGTASGPFTTAKSMDLRSSLEAVWEDKTR